MGPSRSHLPKSLGEAVSKGSDLDFSASAPISLALSELGKCGVPDATGRVSGPESGGSPAVSLGTAGPRYV